VRLRTWENLKKPIGVSATMSFAGPTVLRGLQSLLRPSAPLSRFKPPPTHARRAVSTMDPSANMLKSNRLKQAFLANNGPSMGLWQMLPGTNISRALARSGVDWVMVDCM
jgi:hypothetical protein